MAHPLETTKEYINHLKQYLQKIDPRIRDLPIVPVAAFSPKGDISAIRHPDLAIVDFNELPQFFQRYEGPRCDFYASDRVEQALQRLPRWDKIRLTTSDRWIRGILVDSELRFWGPNGRGHPPIPFARISVVGLNRDGPSRQNITLTIRYVDGKQEGFPFAGGSVKITFMGEARSFDLKTVSRIVVGIANKFH